MSAWFPASFKPETPEIVHVIDSQGNDNFGYWNGRQWQMLDKTYVSLGVSWWKFLKGRFK